MEVTHKKQTLYFVYSLETDMEVFLFPAQRDARLKEILSNWKSDWGDGTIHIGSIDKSLDMVCSEESQDLIIEYS